MPRLTEISPPHWIWHFHVGTFLTDSGSSKTPDKCQHSNVDRISNKQSISVKRTILLGQGGFDISVDCYLQLFMLYYREQKYGSQSLENLIICDNFYDRDTTSEVNVTHWSG